MYSSNQCLSAQYSMLMVCPLRYRSSLCQSSYPLNNTSPFSPVPSPQQPPSYSPLLPACVCPTRKWSCAVCDDGLTCVLHVQTLKLYTLHLCTFWCVSYTSVKLFLKEHNTSVLLQRVQGNTKLALCSKFNLWNKYLLLNSRKTSVSLMIFRKILFCFCL